MRTRVSVVTWGFLAVAIAACEPQSLAPEPVDVIGEQAFQDERFLTLLAIGTLSEAELKAAGFPMEQRTMETVEELSTSLLDDYYETPFAIGRTIELQAWPTWMVEFYEQLRNMSCEKMKLFIAVNLCGASGAGVAAAFGPPAGWAGGVAAFGSCSLLAVDNYCVDTRR